MHNFLMTVATALILSGSAAFAYDVVPEGTTGGRSGGPEQTAYDVIPDGATGGASGGPNQTA